MLLTVSSLHFVTFTFLPKPLQFSVTQKLLPLSLSTVFWKPILFLNQHPSHPACLISFFFQNVSLLLLYPKWFHWHWQWHCFPFFPEWFYCLSPLNSALTSLSPLNGTTASSSGGQNEYLKREFKNGGQRKSFSPAAKRQIMIKRLPCPSVPLVADKKNKAQASRQAHV